MAWREDTRRLSNDEKFLPCSAARRQSWERKVAIHGFVAEVADNYSCSPLPKPRVETQDS
jgi:hypothetical protein